MNGKPKKFYHGQLVAAIFDIPEEVECSRYISNTSVLDPEQVIPDSDIVNMLDEIRKDFPWWDQLNPLWCEIPRYTTHLITNSASRAAKLSADIEELVSTLSAIDTLNDVPANDIPDFEPLPISLGEDSKNEDQAQGESPLSTYKVVLKRAQIASKSIVSVKAEEILGTKSLQPHPRSKWPDPIAEFSEATHADQEQTCWDADQQHMENMAKIEAKAQCMAMKHKIKLAELAYCTAELSHSLAGSSSSASPLVDRTSYPSSPEFDPFPLDPFHPHPSQ
ncbi:hypothetical protein BS47DRAFT_1367204 [Hydnum rufescens UP504]|uniref:Uncharacterized protein n=1 Tax=Hydnum rufescens UP504 TaxID=1448309 RepID=A0A9P6DPU9_9AGAM|nr:hypothetical protein BS47DRAFT_1367204 [Hydnum rufescens UP504]